MCFITIVREIPLGTLTRFRAKSVSGVITTRHLSTNTFSRGLVKRGASVQARYIPIVNRTRTVFYRSNLRCR